MRTSRVLGPTAWDASQHNLIRNNTTGVEALAGAEIRYNRVFLNGVGIEVLGSSAIHHNLIYRNTGSGVLVDGAGDVAVVNNTVYVPGGDGVHLSGFVSNVDIRNNIVMAAGGTGLYVEPESQFGYTSDYNNYFASGGSVAFQGKGFADFVRLAGRSGVGFEFDRLDRAAPDARRSAVLSMCPPTTITSAAARRASMRAIRRPTTRWNRRPNGSRVNLGAYGNTPQADHFSLGAFGKSPSRISMSTWFPSRTYNLLWESNNLGSVDLDIDLIQEGVGWVADIATMAAVAGGTTWTPGNFVTGSKLESLPDSSDDDQRPIGRGRKPRAVRDSRFRPGRCQFVLCE